MRGVLLVLIGLVATAQAFFAPVCITNTHGIERMLQDQPRSMASVRRGDLRMGKMSKFGIASPAVIVAKVALGEARLNKIRGKAISLHSQVITEYCKWVGAGSKMRGLLIKKAKTNGDTLGFLW
ncbi:unnamed protein product [Chrysoparadoxa australica]